MKRNRKTVSALASHEMVVFDSAVKFSVAWFFGRENKGRSDHGLDLEEAIVVCLANPRAVIYACNQAGRSVCLDRVFFPVLLARWAEKKCLRA